MIAALGRQREVELYEFKVEASLVCKESPRKGRAGAQRNPVLKRVMLYYTARLKLAQKERNREEGRQEKKTDNHDKVWIRQ